ncbi:MAG: nicotinamidase/pyrazinamidase [Acidimicrobiia bacterium]|nr:nicotinamidase/pyrazinamidase [Acidimicrobiia bacterium]
MAGVNDQGEPSGQPQGRERSAGADTFGPGTALVIVDVQNDFVDPGGGLYVSGGEDVVEPINDLIDRFIEQGGAVLYTQDWHPPRTPHFVTDGGPWPVHCVAGTWGAELHPRLRIAGEVVRKGVNGEDGYSGFSMLDPKSGKVGATALEGLLEERGARSVFVVGVAGDVCVKATALDAAARGFDTAVVRSAVRSVELQPGDESRAYDELVRAGVKLVE